MIFVETSATIAAGMEPLNRQGVSEALEGKNIVLLTRKEIQKIAEKGVVMKEKWGEGGD